MWLISHLSHKTTVHAHTRNYSVLTGIVWLPCSALMAAWASAWEEYFTNAQPKKTQRERVENE